MNHSSVFEAVAAVKKLKLPHRNWQIAKTEFMAALIAAQPGDVICVTGPSRAGKSQLTKEVCKLMYPASDESFMPVLHLKIHNMASNGRFTSSTFYSEALNKIGHPFYADKGLSAEEAALALRRREVAKPPVILAAFQQSLVARKVACVAMDEVQHLRYIIGGDEGAAGMLDSWKCLAEELGLILVLVGAYPIINVLNMSPHMVGRTHKVHLPRYLPNEQDARAFKAILKGFSRVVETPGDDGLLPWSQILYEGSLGCIGLLSKWLRSAVARAAMTPSMQVTEEILRKSAPPSSDLDVMFREIEAGETLIDSFLDRENN